MSVRAVTDRAGMVWQVWEVIPGSPRTSGPATGQMPNVWGGAPRPTDVPTPTGQDHDRGWLVFMTGSQRRRLAPIPEGWTELDDGALLELLELATR